MTRRTQILLDDERYRRLRARAVADGVSVAAVIRDAIDRELGAHEQSARREAAAAFLAALALPVGEPEELQRELEDLYGQRDPRSA